MSDITFDPVILGSESKPAVRLLTEASSATSATSYNTASMSLKPYSVAIIQVISGLAGAAEVPTVSGLGTWTLINNDAIGTGGLMQSTFYMINNTANTVTGNISIAFTTAHTDASWRVVELTNVDLVNPIVQSRSAAGSTWPSTRTFVNPTNPKNVVLAFMAVNNTVNTYSTDILRLGTQVNQSTVSPNISLNAFFAYPAVDSVTYSSSGSTGARIANEIEISIPVPPVTPISSSDTSSVSISDVATIQKNILASDTGGIAVADAATKAFATPDTGAVLVSDSAIVSASQTKTDTSSVSVSDIATVGIVSNVPGTDTSVVAISDIASISIVSLKTASDSSSVSVTDARTLIIGLDKSASDTGSIVVTEGTATIQTVQTVAPTDTGSLVISDASSVLKTLTITASDTGAIVVLEVARPQKNFTIADTGTVIVSESSAIVISSPVTSKSAVDTGAISVSDSSTKVIDPPITPPPTTILTFDNRWNLALKLSGV